MHIYNISELAKIIGTRTTWYSLLAKDDRKDVSVFQNIKKGNQNLILSNYDIDHIIDFYQNNTRDKGKKRPKKQEK